MQTTTQIMTALSVPVRLKALSLLWNGRERCICELMRELGATQSRMSRHMGALKTAGLVIDRRDAQWVRYRRNPKMPRPIVNIVKAVLASIDREEERHD